MNRLQKNVANLARRKFRVRSKVLGTSERPRLSVYVSNRNITAQIIDDSKHATLVYSSTIGNKSSKGTLSEKAVTIGNDISTKAKAAKISKVVFDRNGRMYHGRIKALADAARAGGLEF